MIRPVAPLPVMRPKLAELMLLSIVEPEKSG